MLFWRADWRLIGPGKAFNDLQKWFDGLNDENGK
jgi:hypothetical protein